MGSGKRRRDANGGAWRKARAAVIHSETTCALCGHPVDKTLHWLDPLAPQVDHVIPVVQGGHPTARSNLQLTHRRCNRSKGDGTQRQSQPPAPTSRAW